MLVLSRKLGEQIVVPEFALSVAVVGINGKTVRLGVNAPAEVAIHREETWKWILASDVACADATETTGMPSRQS